MVKWMVSAAYDSAEKMGVYLIKITYTQHY